MKLIAIAACSLALASCSTPYDTEKSFWTGNTGFSETQLGPNVWQIDFTGNSMTNRDTTKKYTLRKAAQIALREGFPYFRVANNETARDVTGSSYGGGYGGLFGGTSSLYSNTATTTVVELLKKKTSSGGIIYDAKFLSQSVAP